MSAIPEGLKYSAEHEWVAEASAAGTVRIGITDFAQDALGDVVYVDLPEVGSEVESGSAVGEVESTKSVSDLFAPVTGTVTAVNDSVHDDYSIINSDPFGAGWLFEVEVSEVGPLMTAAEYAEATGV